MSPRAATPARGAPSRATNLRKFNFRRNPSPPPAPGGSFPSPAGPCRWGNRHGRLPTLERHSSRAAGEGLEAGSPRESTKGATRRDRCWGAGKRWTQTENRATDVRTVARARVKEVHREGLIRTIVQPVVTQYLPVLLGPTETMIRTSGIRLEEGRDPRSQEIFLRMEKVSKNFY